MLPSVIRRLAPNVDGLFGHVTSNVRIKSGCPTTIGWCQLGSTDRVFRRSFSSEQAERIDNSPLSVPVEDYIICKRKLIRNIAVIAHIDHGKTTLCDKLLQAARGGEQGGTLDRLLDSGELEKERGITISGKVTRIKYGIEATSSVVINIADTPGHRDFSSEVDRFLSVVDGFLLVVDAAEGPKIQTKYVLSRALKLGLKPVVVMNKCDRLDAAAKIDSGETETKVVDLFRLLGAAEEQMNHLTLYASAREGWVTVDPTEALDLADKGYDGDPKFAMHNLLDHILIEIPEPSVRLYNHAHPPGASLLAESFQDDKFSMAAVSVGVDAFLGRTCTGRIQSGSIGINDNVLVVRREPKPDERKDSGCGPSRVSGVFVFQGIDRTVLDGRAFAGDIITVTGVPDSISVGDTLTGPKNPVLQPIMTPPLAAPTLSFEIGSNDGPLSGREGTMIASSKIRDRLIAETDNNVALQTEPSKTDAEKTTIYARGELQVGVLIEQMRREGFELVIGSPKVLTKICPQTGHTLEPYEEVIVDVDSEYAGGVVSVLTGDRRGMMLEMSESSSDGKTQLKFEVPSRGLLGGFHSEISSLTRGSAVVNHLYIGDREQANIGVGSEKGKLVSNESGKASAYALSSLEARGTLFIGPGELVYPGMVIGENAKPGDLEVNPVREKDRTNIRTVAKDEKLQLSPPKRMSVEELIGYMCSDEMIEVTPKNIRLRKRLLDSSARERAARAKAKLHREQKK